MSTRRRTVKLLKKSGQWVLLVVNAVLNEGLDTAAASEIPFGDVLTVVRDRIRNLYSKFLENKQLSEDLSDSVQRYGIMVEEMLSRLNTAPTPTDEIFCERFLPEFRSIVEEFVAVCDTILYRCNKWLHKNFFKKALATTKYNEVLNDLNAELTNTRENLNSFFSLIADANNEARSKQISKSLELLVGQSILNSTKLQSKMDSIASDHLKWLQQYSHEIKVELSENEKSTVKRHEEVMNASTKTHERLEQLDRKIEACLDIIEIKNRAAWKASWRLSQSESKGSRSTACESESGVDGDQARRQQRQEKSLEAVDLTSEDAKLKVVGVHLKVGDLNPGDTSTWVKAASNAMLVSTFLVGVPLFLAGQGVDVITGSKGSLAVGKGFSNYSLALVLCHYWMEIEIEGGKLVSLERTAAAASDADSTNITGGRNTDSGVHMFWRENTGRRVRKTDSLPLESESNITLGDLMVFCDGERGDGYTM